MAEQYVALEGEPDVGRILFEQYLHSDPARWKDWTSAVRRAIADDASTDPLSENLEGDESTFDRSCRRPSVRTESPPPPAAAETCHLLDARPPAGARSALHSEPSPML